MKKAFILLLILVGASSMFAQLNSKAIFNRNAQDLADTLRPWYHGGVRSVVVADDLDKDGKPEILATDYSRGGRVHVLEYVDSENLELVWSSPVDLERNNASTPRWVQFGDLDGDGNGEIIFPVGPRYEGSVMVFENVGDNDYGTQSIIDFPAAMKIGDGFGEFRMDRERGGTVADFDGDGKDELYVVNKDMNVYLLTINGNAPGFASWVVEAGDPTTDATGAITGGSQWEIVSADIDGDDVNEIVNHTWNFHSFSSIEVNGADDYTFPVVNPDGGVAGPYYYEYLKADEVDGVAFMGLAVADVDGDGKDEIASVVYPGYDLSLVSQAQGSNGTDIWEAEDFAILKTNVEMSPEVDSSAQYWGCHAADLNNNGRDEILVGGFYGEKLVAIEYSGSGDIMDGNNYDIAYYYGGEDEGEWETTTITDSAGVVDTVYSKGAWGNPGIMKMSSGDIIGGDGIPEVVASYQANVNDSLTVITKTWDGSAYVEVETKVFNENNNQIRLFQYGPGTGVKELKLNIVTPSDYVLEQNYPNPFNPTTNIRFSLPVAKEISLIVYDMLGREVKTLINAEEFAKGNYEADWNGTNNAGQKVASGNYIYTLKYGNFQKSVKMTLLK
ncbi:MAG: FG-GAP-like repeat-containing protein [Bacteroidota bacterium]